MHLLAQLGDEAQSVGDQQLLGEWLREITFVSKEFAHEACGELGHGMPIIDVARGETKGQQFALIIDDQVQLEAVEPADRGFASWALQQRRDAGECGDCGKPKVRSSR